MDNTNAQVMSFVKELTHLKMVDRGWGNGYVAVPPGHPWYGKNYGDIGCDVHYGLTFGAFKSKITWEEAKQIPEDYYIVGFDTAHLDDNQYKWPKEAVEKETQKLKEQAEEITQ